MSRRRVTQDRRATIAKPALLAEPPQNSYVATNEEQFLRMRLPEAQLEREKQASARLSARGSRSRGWKCSRIPSSSSPSSLSSCSSSSSSSESSEEEESKKAKNRRYQRYPAVIMPVVAAGNGGW